MAKYSKYNVYQGCELMCNLKEAIQSIDAGEYTADDMHKLEARLELYNRFFGGISNTDEQKKMFEAKRDFILRELTEDDKDEYRANLQEELALSEEDARKEFLERVNSINPNSAKGKEVGVIAYDKNKAEKSGVGTNQMTRYSSLKNLPILLNYKCNDDGVFVYSQQEYDYVRICQAVSIKSISFDYETSTQFIQLEFYEYETDGRIKVITLPAEELANGKYNQLIKSGFSISNQRLFTRFINDLRYTAIKNKAIAIKRAALSYGFPISETGGFILDKFVGIDDDCEILPMPGFEGYDKRLLHSKGTLDDYNIFLSKISRGKYQIDFQLIVAASLASIVQAYISENSRRIAPAVYIFTGRTSIGKNILANIASSIWSLDGENNLIASSGASAAFAAAMKDRQGELPYIIADIKDLMNKGEDGQKGVISIVFEHSNGCSSGRATNTGEVRNNKKIWFNIIIAFNENDPFSHNSKITGGNAARMTIIPLGVSPSDEWLTENDPSTYWTLQNKAAGVLGPAFVLAMRSKTQEEVCERFYKIVAELKTEYAVQEKQALSLAMLILTDNLAGELNLLPAEWEPLTADRLINWIGGAKEVLDTNYELYKLLCEQAFKDTSYVSNDDKGWEACIKANGGSVQAAFDSRSKDKNEVRGRKLYQKKQADGTYIEGTFADHDRTLLLIPNANLTQMIAYLKKTYDITDADFDQRSWSDNGWLIPAGNNKYVHKDAFKISVTFERSRNRRESYYAIVLKEDMPEDIETQDTEAAIAAEAEALYDDVPAQNQSQQTSEEDAIIYEGICLEKMKNSLDINAEVNRVICEGCTDEKCIFVRRKDA